MNNMKKILTSIVVPIYNSEKTLINCLDSLVKQTYENIEIILVNDGSVDGSLDICKKYQLKDKRIKIINKINEGVSKARNEGIYKSTGDYIMFVDSDDFLDQNTVSLLMNILETHQHFDLIIFDINRIYKNSNKKCKEIDDTIKEFLSIEDISNILPDLIISERINSPVNKLYKNNIIKDNLIEFDKKLSIGEDLMFNSQYITFINNMCVINKGLYNYNIGETYTLSKSYKYNKYEQLIKVNDSMKELYSKFNNKYNIKQSIEYIRLKNITSCFFDLHLKNELSLNEKIILIEEILNKEKKFIVSSSKELKLSAVKMFGYIYIYFNKYMIYMCTLFAYKVKNKIERIL